LFLGVINLFVCGLNSIELQVCLGRICLITKELWMNSIKMIGFSVSVSLFSGCISMDGQSVGAKGPRLVASGSSMPSGAYYAEVGAEFSTAGDFVALFSPVRWKEPVAVGGSLSWANPSAWGEDVGRTGRILLGEVVVVGAVVAVAVVAGDGGDSGGGSSSSTPTDPTEPPELP
jgi:hypothetical protein